MQCNESHWYKAPKKHRGQPVREEHHQNWCFVAVEEGTGLFHAQMVRKRTRATLETIIHHAVHPGTHIKTDEHKSYYWLGRTTPNCGFHPCRPPLYIHTTVNHSKSFKNPEDGTHTNNMEGVNGNMKAPYKSYHGLPWVFKCAKCKCDKVSIRDCSIFHNSRLTIFQILMIIFLWCTKVKSKDIRKAAGVSDKTVTMWGDYLRNMCTRCMKKMDIKLGTKGKQNNFYVICTV